MDERNWEEVCREFSERVCGGAQDCTCSTVLDMHERLLRLIWEFDATLVGGAGAAAIFARAINLGKETCPGVEHVKVSSSGLDFLQFREYVVRMGCDPDEVHRIMLCLCKNIFDVESDLIGSALTEPKVHRLTPFPKTGDTSS